MHIISYGLIWFVVNSMALFSQQNIVILKFTISAMIFDIYINILAHTC